MCHLLATQQLFGQRLFCGGCSAHVSWSRRAWFVFRAIVRQGSQTVHAQHIQHVLFIHGHVGRGQFFVYYIAEYVHVAHCIFED